MFELVVESKLYLPDHLVFENTLFVQDFDGYVLPCLAVPSKLNLGEAALSKGSSQLVSPDPRFAMTAGPGSHIRLQF